MASDDKGDTSAILSPASQPTSSPIPERKKKVTFADSAETISNDFSSSEADLVLRSSDGVAFHVFSQILAEASAVFHDMVTLGTPHSIAAKENGSDRIPVVDIAEDSSTIDSLLRFIYPLRNPHIESMAGNVDNVLDTLVTLLKAADKYQMEGPLWSLREQLTHPDVVQKAPIRVYTIACMFGLEEEARLASRYTLSVDVLKTPLFSELSHISAKDYLRLVQLHQNRAASAVSILQTATPTCAGCSKEREGVPLWWTEFKERAIVELRQKPCTDVIFGPGFLARCVMEHRGYCTQCPLSYLSPATQARLEHVKERIDALPSMIDYST